MALIPCPECGRMVSTNAEECPNCGAPVKQMLANNAPTNMAKQFTTISMSESTLSTLEKHSNESSKNSFVIAPSSPKRKKKTLLWSLLITGVVVLAVGICLILQDDGDSSSQIPYYVQYGYIPKPNVSLSDSTDSPAENESVADFEYNAIISNSDSDYTNIRDVNRNIIDKLPTNIIYRIYVDGCMDEGQWWYIRDGKVYNQADGTVKKLKGDEWWIHWSCFTYLD